MRSLRLAMLLLFLVPGTARGAETVLVQRELPLRDRSLATVQAPIRFDLLGLHWLGRGAVVFRTRSVSGSWTAWRTALPEAEDLPDERTVEARRSGRWRLGNPYWVGPSDRLQWRAPSSVRRLRAYYVRSEASSAPPRRVSVAGSPAIVSRLGWNANEAIRREAPRYASSIGFAVVHHTAGSNTYSPAQSAAIVRAIEVYHVKGNGWDDIGYNFLVDKYGQIFEGRYGGTDRNVIGAHAQGFNSGSVGVAMIGNYGQAQPSTAAMGALARLLAWRLDLAHVDPLSTLSWLSGGNARFPRGVPVFLRAIAGHRDTGFTDCPGDALYARLNALAGQVAEFGLPKLYAPAVRGSLGGKVRFTARLSALLPWTVTVADGLGQTVAAGAGTGTTIDWTWNAAGIARGRYGYTIAAGAAVRAATGSIGTGVAGPAVALSALTADPATITPDGDGRSDEATISYSLAVPASVTATVVDQGGAPLSQLFTTTQPAGPQSFTWSAPDAPDGRYEIVVTATLADGRTLSSAAEVVVDRSLTGFAVAPEVFSPNGDGRMDTLTFTFGLAVALPVRLRIMDGEKHAATVFNGVLGPGPQTLTWDGSKRNGPLLDGRYKAVVTVTDALGEVSQSVSFVSDRTKPKLQLLVPRRLDFRLSEPATVVLDVDGKRIVKVEPAGRFHVPYKGVPLRLTATAWDAAGNRSAGVRYPSSVPRAGGPRGRRLSRGCNPLCANAVRSSRRCDRQCRSSTRG